MNLELQNDLHNKYPKIFKNKIFIECEDGWYWLIDNLLESIQDYIDYSFRYKKIDQVIVEQIKEKYAGLRFYYQGGDDNIKGMVGFAEDLSFKICSICGSTNIPSSKDELFRMFTLCEKCMNDIKEKKNYILNKL